MRGVAGAADSWRKYQRLGWVGISRLLVDSRSTCRRGYHLTWYLSGLLAPPLRNAAGFVFEHNTRRIELPANLIGA